MKLYNKYAEWWPVLSAPADDKVEYTLFRKAIKKQKKNIKTALEHRELEPGSYIGIVGKKGI